MEGKSATIDCIVTFLTKQEGGRSLALPVSSLKDCHYRPHLVVGDPGQREVLTDGKNVLLENYLGVCFLQGPEFPEFVETGKPLAVLFGLMYWPDIDYAALIPGATFTIREGGRIVGFGTVTRRNVPETAGEKRRKPQLGTAVGQVWMSEDLDAPLSEFEEYR